MLYKFITVIAVVLILAMSCYAGNITNLATVPVKCPPVSLLPDSPTLLLGPVEAGGGPVTFSSGNISQFTLSGDGQVTYTIHIDRQDVKSPDLGGGNYVYLTGEWGITDRTRSAQYYPLLDEGDTFEIQPATNNCNSDAYIFFKAVSAYADAGVPVVAAVSFVFTISIVSP